MAPSGTVAAGTEAVARPASNPARTARGRHSSASRDFPIPAGPWTTTPWHRLVAQTVSKAANSTPRPVSGHGTAVSGTLTPPPGTRLDQGSTDDARSRPGWQVALVEHVNHAAYDVYVENSRVVDMPAGTYAGKAAGTPRHGT
jgi:hypothetical protein